MATKKTIKVRDLKPNKDAKGGGGHAINHGTVPNNSTTNSSGMNKHTVNHGHGVR